MVGSSNSNKHVSVTFKCLELEQRFESGSEPQSHCGAIVNNETCQEYSDVADSCHLADANDQAEAPRQHDIGKLHHQLW